MKSLPIVRLFFIAALVSGSLYAQSSKPPIDASAFGNWPSVRNASITNDGRYFGYTIYNQPVRSSTLFLRALKGKWQMEFPGVGNAEFTEDSRKAVFIAPKDSLAMITLGTSSLEYVPQVGSFRLFKQGKTEWLAYQMNTENKEFVLRNLTTDKRHSFKGVTEYVVSGDGANLVLKTESGKEPEIAQTLTWVTISDGRSRMLWEGRGAGNLTFDEAGTQLAFIVEETGNSQKEKSLWYYEAGRDKASLLANNRSAGIEEGYRLENIQQFSKDGGRLFFKIKEPEFSKPKPDAVMVDVWSYTDPKLQSQQLYESAGDPFDLLAPGGPQSYQAAIDIDERRIIRLEYDNEEFRFFTTGQNDELGFVTKTRGGEESEWYWNSAARASFFLVSTKTGDRKELSINYPYALSPGGRFLIGTDSFISGVENNLLGYDMVTERVRNITQSLPAQHGNEVFGKSSLKHRGLIIVTWLPNDAAVIVHDKYDVWQIDPRGEKRPVCLTNGYGRKNNIVFRISGIQEIYRKTIEEGKTRLLSATNLSTQEKGFFRMFWDGRDPGLLTMGPHEYGSHFDIFAPIKARDAEVYIVQRETASQSPNYFWTSDFKTYHKLSNVHPEKEYNWLTAELVIFKTLDGRSEQGILYKPEDFDRKKKYPVIFHYYEEKAHELNAFRRPMAFMDELEIPWFVSRGYIVFVPDIHHTIAKLGETITNTVVGAAKHLTKFPWVDSRRMGIQGHSFGGYETLYLVTHTDIFAAAMASAGFGDLVSSYGAVMFKGGAPFQRMWAEVGQGRLGATLWEKPDLYIKNSPIFRADKVTTPLLMMNNKKDGIVDFSQGVEFFTALRRLGKRAWMLQYDDEVHSVLYNKKAQSDYTIRMTQFFDHYLKGAPAPKWMTRGIPAKLKGIDDGLEFDHEIKTPRPGLLLKGTGEPL